MEAGAEVTQASQSISINELKPTVSINSIDGDGIVNISERDSGLVLSGSSNVGKLGKVTISLLNTDGSATNFGPMKLSQAYHHGL